MEDIGKSKLQNNRWLRYAI